MLKKKMISLCLCMTCVLTLVACSQKAAPITLPESDQISSVDLSVGKCTVSHTDQTWIYEMISDLSCSEPTTKQSVQDAPQVKNYIQIDFQHKTGTSTFFVYEENGKYYIEQPYQGIYEIDHQLFQRIENAS